jgi:hypothetical protein
MKQLKCVVSDYSVVENNGLIDINFQQSIDIKPNSTIALDKISLEILPNPNGTIILQAPQTITVRTQASGPKIQVDRSFVLPAGTYTYNHTPLSPETAGLPDLLLTMNNLFNSILDGTPRLPNLATSPELDYGLGFKWIGELTNNVFKLTLHVFQQEYAGNQGFPIELNNNQIVNINMTQSVVGGVRGLVSNLDGAFWASTLSPLIQGCMNGWINARIKNIDDAHQFRLGLSKPSAQGATPVISYGISCFNDRIFLLNNGIKGQELDATLFKNKDNLKIWFYTNGGDDNLRMALSLGTDAIFFTTDAGAFTGYDYNQAYHISVAGDSVAGTIANSNQFLSWRWFMQPNTTIDELGVIYNKVPKPNEYYLSTPNLEATTPDRIIQVDFSKAPLLINSLGFSDNILQGKVSFTDHLVIKAANGIDFSSWYDIALDVLNLNIESYVGSSGSNVVSDPSQVTYRNMISGKKNTLAYFLIQRLNPDESVFFSESKQLIFLSLNNQQSMSVSTLQFRIYNVATGSPVNFSTASFNLFIGDDSTNLIGAPL